VTAAAYVIVFPMPTDVCHARCQVHVAPTSVMVIVEAVEAARAVARCQANFIVLELCTWLRQHKYCFIKSI